MNIIRVCNSCTSINAGVEDTESFRQEVLNQLRAQRPDFQWQVEPSPCLKVCPLDRITMTVQRTDTGSPEHLALAREATVEAVVAEALSFFKPIDPTDS